MSTLILLTQGGSSGPPTTASATGAGSATVGLSGLSGVSASSQGGGASSTVLNAYASSTSVVDGGVAVADGGIVFVPSLRLSVLEPDLVQAPATLTVTVSGGWSSTGVQFSIDGVDAGAATTDSDGLLAPTSIYVPDTLFAGTHTVTVTQADALSGSATFTLQRDPAPTVSDVDLTTPWDAPRPVARWAFQDLKAGGLGTYVLPLNPTSMTPPHSERALTAMHTTARAGQFHVFEAGPAPIEWQFSGYCPSQEMHDQLVAWGELNRRFYVIDHRNRAWTVTFVNVDIRPRLRQWTFMAQGLTDWGHDYTVHALIYEQAPFTPAGAQHYSIAAAASGNGATALAVTQVTGLGAYAASSGTMTASLQTTPRLVNTTSVYRSSLDYYTTGTDLGSLNRAAQAGDLIVAFAVAYSGATTTWDGANTSGGWNYLYSAADGSLGYSVAWAISSNGQAIAAKQSSSGASVNLTYLTFRSADHALLLDQATGTSVAATSPTAAASTVSDMAVFLLGHPENTTVTVGDPTGSPAAVTKASSDLMTQVAYRQGDAATAATWNPATSGAAWHAFAIRIAGAA